MRGVGNGSWVAQPIESEGETRLFCFPFAGGGTGIFRGWSTNLAPDVRVCPVQLPGRESRLGQKPYQNIHELVKDMAEEMADYWRTPYALFGHSMGALIAYELTRYLRRRLFPLPKHLFVSAFRAPHLPMLRTKIHGLGDAEFIAELRAYGGSSEVVLQHHEIMQLLLPGIRADFRAHETYQYYQEPPLPVPITTMGGEADDTVAKEELAAWHVHGSREFALQMFAGNHFFILRDDIVQDPDCGLLTLIKRRLLRNNIFTFD